MKLNQTILNNLIKEVMQESNVVENENPAVSAMDSSLSGGATVSGQALKQRFRAAGESLKQMSAEEQVTNNENKVIKKFVDLLTTGAEQLDMDKGASFSLLNPIYKVILQHLEQEIKSQPEGDGE